MGGKPNEASFFLSACTGLKQSDKNSQLMLFLSKPAGSGSRTRNILYVSNSLDSSKRCLETAWVLSVVCILLGCCLTAASTLVVVAAGAAASCVLMRKGGG